MTKVTVPQGLSTNALPSYETPVVIAIRRLDSDNGITEHFLRLAHFFQKSSAPLEFLIGDLVRYNSSAALFIHLQSLAHHFGVGRIWDAPAEVGSGAGRFAWLLTRHLLFRHRHGVLVHTHSLDALVIAAFLSVVSPGIRIVHSFQVTPDWQRLASLGGVFGRRLIRSNPRVQFIAISSEIDGLLVRNARIDRARVRRIFHGVDTEAFRPPSAEEQCQARESLEIPKNRFCVVTVARVEPRKGQNIFLKALAAIPGALQRFRVVIVGSGEETWLSECVHEAGLETIVQRVGTQDTRAFLWAADLFVLASNLEGFPLASLEAMACGRPVIRTDAGGAYDQIEDGLNGFVVPVGDFQALGERITQIADDRGMCERMGRASRERALAMFDLDQRNEERREFFRSAVASGV